MMDIVTELKDCISHIKDNLSNVTGNESKIRDLYFLKITDTLNSFQKEFIQKELFYKKLRELYNKELNSLIKKDEYSYGEETGIQTALNILDKTYLESLNTDIKLSESPTEIIDVIDYLKSIKDKFDNSIQSRIDIIILLLNKIIDDLNESDATIYLTNDNFPVEDTIIVSDGENEFEINRDTVSEIDIE